MGGLGGAGHRPRRRTGAQLTTQAPIDLFLSRVEATGGDGSWNAHCPAHQDHNSSLSISVGDDGRVLTHCHAGCPTDQITAAIGLTLADLFPNSSSSSTSSSASSATRRSKTVGAAELATLATYLTEANRRLAADTPLARRALDYLHRRFGLDRDDALELGLGVDPGNSITQRPDYLARFNGPPRLVIPFNNPDGQPAGCQGRALTDTDGQRVHRWETPKGTGWARTAHMALAAPDPVIITEGPGDALTAVAAGYAAVGIRGATLGRGDATVDELAASLAGRQVVVVGDLDPEGHKFRTELADKLAARGVHARTVAPPDQLGDKADLTDWRRHHPDTWTTQLEQAIADAPPIAPPPPPAEQAMDPDGERRHTDAGNALRLVDQHGQDLRYVGEWARWYTWDGHRWRKDTAGAVIERAKQVADQLHLDARLEPDTDQRKTATKHARDTESANRIRAMVDLARSDPRVITGIDVLDLDQWLLNVDNGTVDLHTGQLLQHRRSDLITKQAPVIHDPDATCPTWLAFLHRIMDGDDELVGFLQRAVGYSLTGSVREQCLMLLYGAGANGKSTFLATIMALLGVGEYAQKTPTETLVARREGAVPNDLARLQGIRFIYASETEAGAKLAESMVKDLTGGDVISARFMRGEWFDFTPVCKTWLATNHRPLIRGTDEAIWRRIRLIPFTVFIPQNERDTDLENKLKSELPGILNWAIEGCLQWQQGGLQPPAVVTEATAGYRNEMDVIGQFIEDRCLLAGGVRVSSRALYDAYRQWAEAAGERPASQRVLADKLHDRGLESFRSNGKWWRGIALVDQAPHAERELWDDPAQPDNPAITPPDGTFVEPTDPRMEPSPLTETSQSADGEGEGSKVPSTPGEGSKSVPDAEVDESTSGTIGTLEPLSPYTPHAHASAHMPAHTRAHGALNANQGSDRSKVPPDAEPEPDDQPQPAEDLDEDGTWEF